MPKTNGKMVYRLVQEMSRSAKKNIYKTLNKKTGKLKSSIKYRKLNNWEAMVYSRKWYSTTQEFGKVITTRNRKWLVYSIDGEIKKTKTVTIPARPFLVPHVNDIMNTGKYKDILEEVLALELDKK